MFENEGTVEQTQQELEYPVEEEPLTIPIVSEGTLTEASMDSLLNGDEASVGVPGSDAVLHIKRLTVEKNVVSVWTNSSTQDAPDYILVNPPTEVQVGPNTFVEDPLGAIAQAIHGAAR